MTGLIRYVFLCFLLCSLGWNKVHSQAVTGNDCPETFYKAYKSRAAGNLVSSMVELNNGELLIGGTGYPDAPAPVPRLGYLTTLDKAGNITSSKNIHYKGDGAVLNLVKMKDGGVLTVSNAGNGADYATAFTRFDAQMNLVWEKLFQPPQILHVTADDAGNIYFISLVGQMFVDQRLVYTKLAPDGQVIYRYTVAYNDPFMVYGLYGKMCLYNNKLYLAIECAKNLAYYTMMVCIDPADGVIQWSRVLGSPDLGELDGFEQLFVVNNRLYANVSLIRTANNGNVLIEFNANGDVLNAKRLSVQHVRNFMRFGTTLRAPVKLTTSGRSKLTTCFAGEDLLVQVC